MPIAPFKLERYYAKYEFNVEILMSSSDCESLSMEELLKMASLSSLAMWDTLKLGYTETQGHPDLRAEIARTYEKISPENLMVAAPEESIYIVMRTLLRAGDHVIVLSPAYQSLYEIATGIGCQVTHWVLRSGNKSWQIDLNELEAAIKTNTRLLVVNFPNNPTGFLPSRVEFDSIVEIARKHGLYIFSDEMYRLLEFDQRDRLPSVCDVYEKGISLAGLSKTLAMPGLRIGWLAAREPGLVENWLTYKDYTTICNSAPSEVLGIIALQNQQAILLRNINIINENLTALDGFFSSYSTLFAWHKPKCGSVVFPCWLGTGTVEEFCSTMLKRYGTMIVPGSLFEFPGDHFRLGLGRKNFVEGLGCLEEFANGVDGG